MVLTRYLSKRLKSYTESALMDAEEGIYLLNEILRDEEAEAYKASLQVWASSLALFSNGGTPPEPPKPPGEEVDEWMSPTDFLKSLE